MADQKKEEFSNPSSGQILGFILKVLGGGFFGLIALVAALGFYSNWDFQRKVDRCNNGKDEGCDVLFENYSSRLNINKKDRDKVTNPVAIPILEKNLEEFKIYNAKLKAEKAAEKAAKLKEESEREAAEKRARYPRISVSEKVGCEMYIQKALKDPRSYKENNSVRQILETGLIDFTAKNSFGGAVRRVFDCNSFTFRD